MRNKFLNKLKKENKLELIDPSENICESYLDKSNDCLKSAKLLSENKLLENSTTMSYYAMYNSLTALLFRTGIKCENHTASLLMLKILFNQYDLFEIILEAKEERIDKQYYVKTEKDETTKEITSDLLISAEDFVLKMKLIIKNLQNQDIEELREKFNSIMVSSKK